MTELTTLEELKQLAARLKLHGLLAHWNELNDEDMPRIQAWLHWEETEGKKRGWNAVWARHTWVASSH
jgi:hypothetical protein